MVWFFSLHNQKYCCQHGCYSHDHTSVPVRCSPLPAVSALVREAGKAPLTAQEPQADAFLAVDLKLPKGRLQCTPFTVHTLCTLREKSAFKCVVSPLLWPFCGGGETGRCSEKLAQC